MLKKEKDILQEIADKFNQYLGIIKAIVYGSRVRGDNRDDSDLDVVVIVDKKDKIIKDKILDLFYTYELEKDISFCVTIFSIKEYEFNERLGSPFIKALKKEGIIFYESGQRRKKLSGALST